MESQGSRQAIYILIILIIKLDLIGPLKKIFKTKNTEDSLLIFHSKFHSNLLHWNVSLDISTNISYIYFQKEYQLNTNHHFAMTTICEDTFCGVLLYILIISQTKKIKNSERRETKSKNFISSNTSQQRWSSELLLRDRSP